MLNPDAIIDHLTSMKTLLEELVERITELVTDIEANTITDEDDNA